MSLDPSPTPTAEIENLLAEDRTFPPDPAFTAQANATADLYEEAEADPEAFWARLARERIDWVEDFHTTLEWDLPFAKWFVGGKLNLAYNCIDRHVERGLGDKVAYHWIGEPGDTRTITFADLQREVSKAANALLELGIKTGDRVAIYMPMIPELPIAMLACARIGAPHTVVFGGFSAEALSGRINDAQAKLVITADGGWRRGKAGAAQAGGRRRADHDPDDRAHARRPPTRRCVEGGTAMQDGRDVWWHDIVDRQSETHEPVPLDSEHMLYLLYTSGTTAKPKGIIHTTRRLSPRRELHPRDGLRHQARRRVLVRGGRGLGDRPQLHRLRPARQRHDQRALRGHPGHPRLGPLVADHRGLQGQHPVLRADRDPGAHEAGRRVGPRRTTSRACASWARSASRSTRSPGSGTTSTSAAVARRSSTRGGRPRPA